MRSHGPLRTRRTITWNRIDTLLLLLGAAMLGSQSCSENTIAPRVASQPAANASGTNCGVSYTLTTYEMDSLMAQYDIPATYDTIAVCETWVGSDYSVRSTFVGSSESAFEQADSEPVVTYASGAVQGLNSNGTLVETANDVGPTSFDFMLADSSTVQASYDDPYYGVYSPGGGGDGFCADTTQCHATMQGRKPLGAAPVAGGGLPTVADDTTRYRRHGLHRRGVRAMVDALDEIERSPEGYRRFRKVTPQGVVVLSVDPGTELLVAEEFRGNDGLVMKSRHSWQPVPGGFVKEKTELDDEEVVRGQTYRSHSTITFHDVRFGAVPNTP